MKYSERVKSLEPEGAYFVLEKAQRLESQGREIIHLEIGQPDFPTFENITEAGMQAIRDGDTRYTAAAGKRELREAVAADAGRRRGMQFDPAQVVIGPGAKPALFFPTLAVIEPGDEVIYPDPGFPTYKAMVEVAGGVPVPVPLVEEQDFSFDMGAFDALVSDKTRMIVLNSPSNPTGGIMPVSSLSHIARAAVEGDIWVLSDEIYSRLVYGEPAPTIATLPGMADRTIICDGFSKTYSMTGWRLGYGIMPVPLAEKVALLHTHSVGSTADFTQTAGLEAVTGDQDQVEEVVAEYRHRRDVLVDGLNQIPGITCRRPQGAFYVFPNVTASRLPSEQIADYLLEEAEVAVLPGTSFGENGEGYLRLCFANSLANIEAALERIASALAQLRK